MTPVPPHGALSHDEAMELAGLYVLDALEAEEMRAVRDHLATCHEAHHEFAALGSVAPALGSLFEPREPPPELKDRVMAAIAADAPQAPAPQREAVAEAALRHARPATSRPADASPVSLAAARERRRPWSQWGIGTWAMASAAVLLIAVLGAWNLALQGRADETGRQLAALEDRAEQADQQLVALEDRAEQAERRSALVAQAIGASADPNAQVAVLRGAGQAQAATGFAAFPRDGAGYIVLVDLPPAPAGRTWQAWSIVDGQATSMGVMSVGEDGYAVLADVPYRPGTDLVALTIEEAGGAQRPSSEPIVSGRLSA
jgi:hypothetical protein